MSTESTNREDAQPQGNEHSSNTASKNSELEEKSRKEHDARMEERLRAARTALGYG